MRRVCFTRFIDQSSWLCSDVLEYHLRNCALLANSLCRTQFLPSLLYLTAKPASRWTQVRALGSVRTNESTCWHVALEFTVLRRELTVNRLATRPQTSTSGQKHQQVYSFSAIASAWLGSVWATQKEASRASISGINSTLFSRPRCSICHWYIYTPVDCRYLHPQLHRLQPCDDEGDSSNGLWPQPLPHASSSSLTPCRRTSARYATSSAKSERQQGSRCSQPRSTRCLHRHRRRQKSWLRWRSRSWTVPPPPRWRRAVRWPGPEAARPLAGAASPTARWRSVPPLARCGCLKLLPRKRVTMTSWNQTNSRRRWNQARWSSGQASLPRI